MDFPYQNKSGETFPPKFIFIWRSHIKILENSNFQTAVKIVWQVLLTQNFASFDAESEFGIHFVSDSTVTTSLVLMSRTDFENTRKHLSLPKNDQLDENFLFDRGQAIADHCRKAKGFK